MPTYATTLTKVNALKSIINSCQGVSASVEETPSNEIILNITGDGEHTPYFEEGESLPGITKWIWFWDSGAQEWVPGWVPYLQLPDEEETEENTLSLTWSNFD